MIVRSLKSRADRIYLTFDDGPDPVGTAAVLDVLAKMKVHATFFLVASRLRAEPDLLRRIQHEGHAIGNHSWDHRYGHFFARRSGLEQWLDQADREFTALGVPSCIGFRPPAGVITPPLLRALRRRQEPLVLWSERFFDGVFPWSAPRARASARRLEGGSIVLLHDRQSAARVGPFCAILAEYIEALQGRGFVLEGLTRELCVREDKLC